MTLLPNAVVKVDHHHAEVLRFDAEHAQAQQIKAHDHYTRQHGSAVRTEHEFFGEICDTLSGVAQVLVVGVHSAQADFRHYVEKHRSTLAPLIVTEGQLLASPANTSSSTRA
jgi:hypothetical protein